MKGNLFENLAARTTAMLLVSVTHCSVFGKTSKKPKYVTDIPPSITTPDSVETRLGTLRFFDGMPDGKTVQLAYDNLDFQRGVSVFLNTIPIASMSAMRKGLREGGVTKTTWSGSTKN